MSDRTDAVEAWLEEAAHALQMARAHMDMIEGAERSEKGCPVRCR